MNLIKLPHSSRPRMHVCSYLGLTDTAIIAHSCKLPLHRRKMKTLLRTFPNFNLEALHRISIVYFLARKVAETQMQSGCEQTLTKEKVDSIQTNFLFMLRVYKLNDSITKKGSTENNKWIIVQLQGLHENFLMSTTA